MPQLSAWEGRRRLTAFAGLAIACYLAAMVATMPASVIFRNRPWRTGVEGTVWNGAVGIAGGSTLSWDWAPLRSLSSLGFAADWRLTGADNDLGGRALLRPGGRMVLDHVSGAADSALLAAIQPTLPFRCQMPMQIELPMVAIGGGARAMEGTIITEAGACAPADGGAMTPVPALHFAAEHVGQLSRLRLAPATQRRRTLMDARLAEEGTLSLTLTPQGAAALPFAGLPGGASIDLRM